MKKSEHIGRGLATIGICILGGFSMWVSGGETGVGWAIVGIIFIWG